MKQILLYTLLLVPFFFGCNENAASKQREVLAKITGDRSLYDPLQTGTVITDWQMISETITIKTDMTYLWHFFIRSNSKGEQLFEEYEYTGYLQPELYNQLQKAVNHSLKFKKIDGIPTYKHIRLDDSFTQNPKVVDELLDYLYSSHIR